jgi:transposase-like protein
MAGTTRRKFTAEFEAQVAMAALKGDKTVAEIAQAHGIHPAMVTKWKGRLEKGAARVVESEERQSEPPVDVDALYRKIGQIGQIERERDFLVSRPGIIAALQRGGR